MTLPSQSDPRSWGELTDDEIAMHALRAVVHAGHVAGALAELDDLYRSVLDMRAFELLQRLVAEYLE
jgi:hypothetical protein